MPLLKLILRHRLVWLMAMLGLVTLITGRWLLPAESAVQLVAKGGYWVMLLTSAFFVHGLWRLGRHAWTDWRPARGDYAAAALVMVCGGIWHAHERPGFKILADEVLLLGTSMVMHQEREVSYPIRATDVQGPFQFTHKVVDKRPFFYPFLVSLVHDTTGYRGTNPFWVNTALGFLFLGLIYVIAWRLAASRWAGVFAVLLFTGLPLLAQQAAGGGFELLNLVLISGVILLGWRYAERPDDNSLTALCLAAVLLAYTRYESVLFILPVAAIALWGWVRVNRVILPGMVVAAPLLLLPYVLQNRVFEANTGAWELASKPEAGAPFAFSYVADNLGHALGFFFDLSGYQPNSIFFAAGGLLALPFFALIIVRTLRAGLSAAPREWVVAMIGLGLFGIGALLMLYFWGQFDHPVIRRLSLPVHLLMALAIVVVGARLIRSPAGWRWTGAAALIALLLQGVPSMARQAYAWEYMPGIEMAWRQEFIRRHPQKDYLFIDRDSIYWITQRVAATAIAQAADRREGLAFHLRNHTFTAMYVFQRFTVDQATGALTLDPADDIGPGFDLEPVLEKRIATLHLARISRITAIHAEDGTVARQAYAQPVGGPAMSKEEFERAKAAYLEQWMKQLP
ncbi:MAG: glycosyltransferase family 39 protein [Opitutaceae bacterium]|nr:glycosyltransferase family 39 protein [Opitutaceae bacterium]